MIELDSLIDYCYNQYTQSSCTQCNIGEYCKQQRCIHGNCAQCLEHILHDSNPQFHYPCKRITYFYTLRFFARFVSEIERFFHTISPRQNSFYFVSLGCGPGSELYGIVEGLRHCTGNNFQLKYRGYDTEGVWEDVQNQSKNLFRNTNCDVDFHCCDMFANWQDISNCQVDVLVMNYLLSDCQKYMSKNGSLIPFLDNIVSFIIQHRVTIVMCNDIRLHGYSGLDSGVKCMDYILSRLALTVKVVRTAKIYYPNDTYKPYGWYHWNSSNIIVNVDKTKTDIADGWDECRSKYIVARLFY